MSAPHKTLRPLHDAVDGLLAIRWDAVARDDLLDTCRALQRVANRLAAVDHELVAELDRRGSAVELGARDTAALLRALLRLHPGEARSRVAAADLIGSRRSLHGEPVPPELPILAAAQAAGDVTVRHAQVIARAVATLPDTVRDEHGPTVERQLVEHARAFDPYALGRIAERVHAHLDPDGLLRDAGYRERHRDLTVAQRPDGSARLDGELTAECAERLLTCLDPLAAPRPAAGGRRDPRTAGQRRHDGLLDALIRLGSTGRLPDAGGVSTTVLLTVAADDWSTGTGVATTGHGAVVPTAIARGWTGGDARELAVGLGHGGADPGRAGGGITGWTDARRLFSGAQRLAMAARDGGCTFPGCPVPAAWCQAHHLLDHADGGPTTTGNGALVCGHDHRVRVAQGWSATIVAGRVAWVPPAWLDPQRTPRVNMLHRPTASAHRDDRPP
ncbi:protein of unknown function [Jatrophihabitans endophyticus]|uniref:HNH nuclease domain-containing protein n=1 Tax=Jatrophihabitans endophyticus TaxID=1206085 RepID=A0A1M5HZ86_9ACTN|nr:HNH endonuclease signature motif containing protein [Jatrophihabitans endophyticus]SHG21328.1 protein of unknown function [Jatrophihabitans endophyticus]